MTVNDKSIYNRNFPILSYVGVMYRIVMDVLATQNPAISMIYYNVKSIRDRMGNLALANTILTWALILAEYDNGNPFNDPAFAGIRVMI